MKAFDDYVEARDSHLEASRDAASKLGDSQAALEKAASAAKDAIDDDVKSAKATAGDIVKDFVPTQGVTGSTGTTVGGPALDLGPGIKAITP